MTKQAKIKLNKEKKECYRKKCNFLCKKMAILRSEHNQKTKDSLEIIGEKTKNLEEKKN